MKNNRIASLFSSLSHKHLNATAALSLLGMLTVVLLYAIDTREILGVSVWEKPLKFLISATVYATTFSWLYAFVDKGKKLASLMGSLIAIMLVVELIAITGMASVGSTSHFNVSTPFNIAVWSVMATAISIVWVATFLLSAGLWNSGRMSADLRLAVRWAIGLGLAGMGIAFTMTPPQPQQTLPENWAGVAGAHTVGAADGGPGLPFFGWSTEAGDLRVSHFFGLHALQVLPLVALLLSVLVASDRLRVATITGVATSYTLVVAFTYVQALLGQTIAQASTLVALGSILLLGLTVAGLTYRRSSKTTAGNARGA
ncbi:MAG: hypothetical protein RIE23_06900 [Pontimonas sp.]